MGFEVKVRSGGRDGGTMVDDGDDGINTIASHDETATTTITQPPDHQLALQTKKHLRQQTKATL